MRRRLTVKAIEDIEAKAGTMAEDCPAVIATVYHDQTIE